MKKGIVCLVICFTAILSFVLGTQSRVFTAQESNVTIQVDGVVRKFWHPVVTIDQRNYISVRDLCDKLGAEIAWDGETQTISIFTNEAGFLESGRKYVFTGYDKGFRIAEIRSLEQTQEVSPNIDDTQYTDGVATPKLAAEIWEKDYLADYERVEEFIPPVEDEIACVDFDRTEDCWVIHPKYVGKGTVLGGCSYLCINRKTGKVTKYSEKG